jgi:hypothetical protein
VLFGIFLENKKISVEMVVKGHDSGNISTSVTVVGCRPYSDNLLIKHVLVALLDELVGAANQIEIVDTVEIKGDARAKQPAGTAR